MSDEHVKEYIRYKIHGGKIEDLSPEIQVRLSKPSIDTHEKRSPQ